MSEQDADAMSRREKMLDLSQMSGGPVQPDTSIKAVRAAMDRIEEKFGATKKLTVRLRPELFKQLKIAATEAEITIERYVELALEQKLQG